MANGKENPILMNYWSMWKINLLYMCMVTNTQSNFANRWGIRMKQMTDKEDQIQQKAKLDEKLKECLECGNEFYGDFCPDCLSRDFEVKKESKLKKFLKLFKTDKKQYVTDDELEQFLKDNPEMLEIVRMFFSINFNTGLWMGMVIMGIIMLLMTLFSYNVGLIGLQQFNMDLILICVILIFSGQLASVLYWIFLNIKPKYSKIKPKNTKGTPTFLKILRGDF